METILDKITKARKNAIKPASGTVDNASFFLDIRNTSRENTMEPTKRTTKVIVGNPTPRA
ncbi:MAG: hypothetical protein ABJU26_06915 [Flavobacteriaceae bacterium]